MVTTTAAPPRRPHILVAFALAVVVGGSGGTLFYVLDLPLPWMLGSMSACMFAAIVGLPVATPAGARPPMSAVVGAMLGAGFPTDLLGRLVHWIVPILGLIGFMLTCAILCVTYFRYVAKFDPKTAYFCGMPGGLIEMTMMGEEVGADSRRIALIHTARVLMIVFTVPFLIRLWGHSPGAAASVGNAASLLTISPWFLLWLAGTCVAGIVLGNLLKLPARYLIGPMLVSGVLHVSGVTDFVIPVELVVVAQVVLGATIGCRFAGTTHSEVARLLLLSVGSTAILITVTVAFGVAISSLTGIDPVAMILAYSPGGLAEMGLVALALNFDTAFVATHHIARVALVSLGASFAFRIAARFRKT